MSRATHGQSAQRFRHVEGLAHGPPDDLHVLAVGQRLVDRPAAEHAQHLVLGHALRIPLAEKGLHPRPELRQPHSPRLLTRLPAPLSPLPALTLARGGPASDGARLATAWGT